jgi:hypothetical protein
VLRHHDESPRASGGDGDSAPGRAAPHATEIHLRPSQAWLLGRLGSHSEDALAEAPTGSGKTVTVRALTARDLGRRFSHIMIAAPQEQIESTFVSAKDARFIWPNGLAAQPTLESPANLIVAARAAGWGSRTQLRRYLGADDPGYAIACTHATLTGLQPEDFPPSMKRMALIVDESHHVPAVGLSRIVKLCKERGCRIYLFTATPFRADGLPVALPGMRIHRISIAEHMHTGYAPRTLDSEIVALGGARDRVTAAQFTGDEAPPRAYEGELVAAIVQQWESDARPKAIVRVPPGRTRKHGLIARLVASFARAGARVLDASGTSRAVKERFLTALDAERARTLQTSEIDVVIGIMRVVEGSDWPHCSAGYCIGVPGSLTTTVQYAGRTQRKKPDTYRPDYKERSKLVFFVPRGAGKALEKLEIDHSRHALLLSAFLADCRVGNEWIVTQAVRAGIKAGMDDKKGNEDATAVAEEEADAPLPPALRAGAQLALTVARDELVAAGEPATLGDVIARAAVTRRDLPEEAIARVAVEALVTDAGETGGRARSRITQLVAAQIRIDPQVRESMKKAFAGVLEEFRADTLVKNPLLDEMSRQLHRITGGDALRFAKRLAEASPRPLTRAEILAWADRTHEKTAKWPTEKAGDVLGVPGETWNGISFALRKGSRGLEPGSSLAKLLEEERGVPNHLAKPDLDEKTILELADAWFKTHKKWPTRSSGKIPGTNDTWMGIERAMQEGGRGLEKKEGGDSIARLLMRERAARNIRHLPRLTEKLILKWADAYKKKHGTWPTKMSGLIPGGPAGETWSTVSCALVGKLRKLPRRWITLAVFLGAKRKAKSAHKAKLELTEKQIIRWARDYKSRTGKWPVATSSDSVLKSKGESWIKIDRALRMLGRGLSRKTTIVKLVSETLRGRNKNRPGDLTKTQIREWARAHKKRTGKWPTPSSGAVVGAPGETWHNINAALHRGGRGLPTGLSLKKLLEGGKGKRRGH